MDTTTSESAALSMSLQIASQLAFAMPPPWGPIGAGALMLMNMLFGTNQTSALDEAVKTLENFVADQRLSEYTSALQSYSAWLDNQAAWQETVETVAYNDIQQFITDLETATAPNADSVYELIGQLQSMVGDTDQYGAFQFYVLATSLYILTLKMLVQLKATLASQTYASDVPDYETASELTEEWLDAYAQLVQAINGLPDDSAPSAAQQVADTLSNLTTYRLGQVTGPYEWDHQTTHVIGTCGCPVTTDDYGWTFIDKGPGGDTNPLHNFISNDTGDAQGQVQANQAAYVAQLSQALDAQYADATATIQQWSAAIQEWSQNQPPQAPTTAPAIANWTASAPSGPWIPGWSVAYAAMFVNESGPSAMGPWSPMTAVAGADPTLTLPTDPLEQATAQRIFRQFQSPQGQTDDVVLALVTDDPTVTTIVDDYSGSPAQP